MEIDNIFYNQLGLPNVADSSQWKESATELIGDEPVEVRLVRFTRSGYPIVRISSEDPEALTRVFDKAIAVSDLMEAI